MFALVGAPVIGSVRLCDTQITAGFRCMKFTNHFSPGPPFWTRFSAKTIEAQHKITGHVDMLRFVYYFIEIQFIPHILYSLLFIFYPIFIFEFLAIF